MSDIRVPPNDLVAERSVLGCQMIDTSVVQGVEEIIQWQDYYSDVHQILQRAISSLAVRKGAADAVILADYLASTGELSDVGGTHYLVEVLESVPFSVRFAYYASIVALHSRRRKAIEIGRRLMEKSYDVTSSFDDLVESAVAASSGLAKIDGNKNKRPRPLSAHVYDSIERYRIGELPTVWWGIPEIDQMLKGVATGELVILAGRPSMGKSMICLQWLDRAAANGITGLLVSEEMTEKSVADRFLSYVSNVPSDKRMEMIDQVDRDAAAHFESRKNVFVAHKFSTIAAVESVIERHVQQHDVKIVAVDYAQMIEGEGSSVAQRVGDVSSKLKSIASRHGLIVLLLASCNRAIENRDSGEPKLSDLRDSGGLESDADIVMFCQWPWKSDPSYARHDEYRIYCCKNRNRGTPSGPLKMRIDPQRQMVESWDEHREFDW